MNTMFRVIIAVFITVFLAGCATGPKFSEISPKLSNVMPDKGRIYIYRTSVFGAAIQPEVKLNGNPIGKAVPQGFFYVDRDPGEYQIETSTEVERHLSLVLEIGQTRYVRLNINMGFFVGHVYPELLENQVGEKEIQKCSYTGQQ